MNSLSQISTLALVIFALVASSCSTPSKQCRDALSECAMLPAAPSQPSARQCNDFLEDLNRRMGCLLAKCSDDCKRRPEMCAVASAGMALIESGEIGRMSLADADIVANKFIEAAMAREQDSLQSRSRQTSRSKMSIEQQILQDLAASDREEPRVPPEFKQDCERICSMRKACRGRGVSIPYPKLCQEVGVECAEQAASASQQ